MARDLRVACLRDVRGTVMVEFLIAFMPVFVLFLGIVQLVMIAAADLVVRHAAIMAARSASVVLAEEPKYYSDEPVGSIQENGGASDSALLETLGIGDDVRASVSSMVTKLGVTARTPGPRLAAIRRAASVPVAAIAPNPLVIGKLLTWSRSSLQAELGDSPAERLASAWLLYDGLALALTFPTTPGSADLREGSIPLPGNVTVRTTYLFHCGVPIGSALLCASLASSTLRALASGTESDEARALDELKHAPSSKSQVLLSASRGRFRTLRAEATLPVHYAAYARDATKGAP